MIFLDFKEGEDLPTRQGQANNPAENCMVWRAHRLTPIRIRGKKSAVTITFLINIKKKLPALLPRLQEWIDC
jgi:hypothetical protein